MHLFQLRRAGFLFISVVLSCACGKGAAAAIDSARMAEADGIIEAAIARKGIPGAVLMVERGSKTVYLKAYGNRAVQPEVAAMSTDTIFDMASLSKPVGCATSIMILAERGKLKISDPVAKYIPAFAANGKEKITIED